MRRASLCAALCGIAALGVPAAANAAPSVTFKAKPVPIPKHLNKKHSPNWPGTGDILGAPAAVEATFKITGTEYNGFPAPLRSVVVYLPKGVKVNPGPFKTCSQSLVQSRELYKCPKATLASPPGEVRGEVQFGEEEPVKETVLLQAYFLPKNGLGFWIEGKSPVQIEEAAIGKIQKTGGKYGLKTVTEAPLIVPVPGSHAASSEYINVKIGAAIKKHKKLISYGKMPSKCPKSGFFEAKAELTFGVKEGEGPTPAAGESPMETVTKTTKFPCPKQSVKGKKSNRGKGKGGHRHHK